MVKEAGNERAELGYPFWMGWILTYEKERWTYSALHLCVEEGWNEALEETEFTLTGVIPAT